MRGDGRPILSLAGSTPQYDKANLVRDFPKLQAFLEPMQIWFFEKRRVARTIEKVFDKEFNLQRVEEFRSFIDRRLSSKRNVVLENFRRNIKPDDAERVERLKSATVENLVEAYMFMSLPTPQVDTTGGRSRDQGVSFHDRGCCGLGFMERPRDAWPAQRRSGDAPLLEAGHMALLKGGNLHGLMNPTDENLFLFMFGGYD